MHHTKIELSLDIVADSNNIKQYNQKNYENKILSNIENLTGNSSKITRIILGPNDIFECSNFDDIVNLKDILSTIPLSIRSTLLSDKDTIRQRWNQLQIITDNAPINILVSFDLKRYLSNDIEYIDIIKSSQLMFNECRIIFEVNFSEGMFNNTNISEVGQQIKTDFGTQLRIIPSFLSSTLNHASIEQKVQSFKEMIMMQSEIVSFPRNGISSCGPDNSTKLYLSYSSGNLYTTPHIYNHTTIHQDPLIVPTPTTIQNVTKIHETLIESQNKYSHQTMECSTCSFLAQCVDRRVLTYMEELDLMYCMFIKDE